MEIHNLNEGRIRRHAALVVPSLLLALSLAGVAARPNLSLSAARRELSEAEQRVHERQVHADNLSALERSGGRTRLGAMTRAVRDMLPAPLPKLELHGLLRVLAQRTGVELSGLEILEPHDAGLEPLDDVATLREVRIEGTCTMSALLAASSAFRSLGRPVAVLELSVARAQRQGSYHWTMVLGLFESGPAPVPEDGEQASSAGGEG